MTGDNKEPMTKEENGQLRSDLLAPHLQTYQAMNVRTYQAINVHTYMLEVQKFQKGKNNRKA